jgi:uncharacterized protein (DUF885 family)
MILFRLRFIQFISCCVILFTSQAEADSPELRALAREFFAWRASTQPATGDDVPRVERPDGWVPNWSADALARYNAEQKQFRRRLMALKQIGWTVADSVDFLLLRSAIARVDFELNVVRSARRNPGFYVQQTLGAVYELLLQPPPFSDSRTRNIILRLESIPRTLSDARDNLTEPVAAFAKRTVEELANVKPVLEDSSRELRILLPVQMRGRFFDAATHAADALVDYRDWIKNKLPEMKGLFAIGRDAYDKYLKEVSLMPYTGDDLLRMAAMEWDRAVAFDHLESLRDREIAPASLFPNSAAQIEAEKQDEEAIRRFLVQKGILDVPRWMGHYWNLKIPSYLVPLSWLGVTDDLTSASRLGQDAISYIPEPSPNLSFFRKASAQDPRPLIVHEGVPGHFFQLTLSWANPDTIRRHYFDSGPVEGIAFYAEEMMLQQGLFDDRPHTREIIYRFMRLRALRVDVDVKLARGEYTIDDAARYLAQTVPMDLETAKEEAASFAANPGQAITYQIGKIQILKLVADAKIQLKDKFDLRLLHNFLWQDGNVPISLLRWEYLGRRDEIEKLW